MFTRVRTTKAYWKLLKKASKPTQSHEIGPITREDGTICVRGMEKAELFNNYFASVGQNLAKELPTPNISETTTYIHRVTPTIDTINVDPKRVAQLVTSLKQDKAPGPDNIAPKILKAAGEPIVPSLVSLFNISANSNKLPNVWKTARMTSVYKKGDKTDKENYRPLSNLCLLSKVMETLVSDTIKKHVMEDHNMITEKQWAYRKGYSTELLLIQLTEKWKTELEKGNFVAAAFIDFRKAFDSIPHYALLKKLQAFGITGDLYHWIENYLNNRKQYTQINGKTSNQADVTFGVPQGSVLGPLLFSLFTSDLPNKVGAGDTYLYADDTTLYCIAKTADRAVNLLNRALNELYEWSITARLTIHPKKCEAMLIHKRGFMGPLKELRIGNGLVKWVASTRLLGVTLDNRLNWVKQLIDLRKTYAGKLALLGRMKFLPRDALEEFYNKVILPSVLYGQILWSSGGKTHLDSMEKLHARAARIVHSLPWDMDAHKSLNTAEWPTLDTLYKRKLLILTYRAQHDDNTPKSIKDMFTKKKSIYELRRAQTLDIPRPETEFGRSTIKYRAVTIWNSLPNEHRILNNNIDNFKNQIKLVEALHNFSFEKEACIITRKYSDFKYF